MNIPADLKYTKEHEWIKIDGDNVLIGITDYAQGELGDIVFIEIETVGDELGKDEVLGTIEAVKTVSDLFMPIAGKVVEFNSLLEQKPELINKDPYGDGWIVKIKFNNRSEIDELIDADGYKILID